MKKVILFGAAAIFALSLASCKKDYTCTCTSNDPAITSIDPMPLGKQTKKEAKKKCADYQTLISDNDGSVSCSI